jgi:hypothetical protein
VCYFILLLKIFSTSSFGIARRADITFFRILLLVASLIIFEGRFNFRN